MAEKIDVDLAQDQSGDFVCRVRAEPELCGHDARLEIVARVEVKDSRPVHEEKSLFSTQLSSLAAEQAITVPRRELFGVFSYSGKSIDLEVHTRVVVDDGLIFDTKVGEEQQIALGLKPAVTEDAEQLVDPKDAFSFTKNLQAIPAESRLKTLILAAVGAVVVLFNMALGLHDEFVPEERTYFYDHRDSDGDSESPFFKALMGSGAAGAGIWALIRRQLKKYMVFELRNVPPEIRYGDTLRVSELIRGGARVPLENTTLRIVACNMECGQYVRGSGTDRRTVSFRNPARAVVLYEKHVPHIPAGSPVETHYDGEVRFEAMFEALYPPYRVSSSHGIEVHWEIQLLHPELVDQELSPSASAFAAEDFL